ncbi:MAG: Dabb family protein [Campylobacterales bacterium]
MIRHIVFFQLPKDTTVTPDELVKELMSMKGRVASLQEIEAGCDFSREERSYDVALITTFSDRNALRSYASDPYHQEIISWIKQAGITSKVVDYEI